MERRSVKDAITKILMVMDEDNLTKQQKTDLCSACFSILGIMIEQNGYTINLLLEKMRRS